MFEGGRVPCDPRLYGRPPGVEQSCSSHSCTLGEGSEDYRQWVTDAREAYDAGKYDEAAALLLKAFEKSADPNILYNLARCYQQDARHADAIRSYQEYGNLADTPEDKDGERKFAMSWRQGNWAG